MRWFTVLTIYRLLLPLLFFVAFPGWLVKMLRRGGFSTRLGERATLYSGRPDLEPCGAIHIHAVSVGESALAIKLIRQWLHAEPDAHFVLAVGTATGHHVCTAAAIPEVRVVYAPLDLPFMVHRYMKRFEPARVILIEGDIWPYLLLACRSRGIPVSLVNARMSPRSARRYRRFATWLQPLFALLDAVAIQEKEDAKIWQTLGVDPPKIHLTGSMKFDPAGGSAFAMRPEFQEMLDAFGSDRSVVLAASTHDGEEPWIASAIRAASANALPVVVPRHAERREEVRRNLESAGFKVVLRSRFAVESPADNDVFVIDSTGELCDWTAHADVVIIGKSFLATGGQNPTEAVMARKPVVFGPHMENFEPLASRFVNSGACIRAMDSDELAEAIKCCLDPQVCASMTAAALEVLSTHEGATQRILELFLSAKKL